MAGDPVEITVSSARRIRLYTLKCGYCGKEFLGPSNRRYCSVECKWRRDYAALRARGQARPPMHLRDWSADAGKSS